MTTPTIQSRLVIGVDVGGTKVAAGTVNDEGRILSQTRLPMIPDQGASAGLQAIRSALDTLIAQSAGKAIAGIGICAPGPLDPATGLIINPPNLPCWRNYPLAATVAGLYDLPVKVDNDANAAALAEARWGAGRGYCNVFYATIGTGIGTGIILDGRIFHGRTGAAGEGGHVSIDYDGPICKCGKPGCIEALAAGPAIARHAREMLAADSGRASMLLDLAQGDASAVTSEMVGQACDAGDALALAVVWKTVCYLSIWLASIVDLLDPDVIVMGGGVSNMLGRYLGEIRERLPRYCVNPRCHEVLVVPARYGTDAGIAGGAALFTAPVNACAP